MTNPIETLRTLIEALIKKAATKGYHPCKTGYNDFVKVFCPDCYARAIQATGGNNEENIRNGDRRKPS